MNKKLVFSFAEGDGKNKKLLGGKGANLCEMTQIGLNVPPGFVITTEACLDYLQAKEITRSPAWRRRREGHSGLPVIRCWSRSGRAPRYRCLG
jgi:phosphoenolpyruvate synthase/pyruvate phosphate dikinase